MASNSPSTITREHFLSLMAQQGGQSSADLVEQLLGEGAWATKAEFTQADVVYVMDAVAAYARKAFTTNPAAVADPEGQRHALGMIDMLEQHALPLLHRETAKES